MPRNKYKIFVLSAIVLAAFLFLSSSAFAEVSKIVFINEPQTIILGQSSAKYQIQLQDSGGVIATSTDTTYLTLPLDLGDFSTNESGAPYTNSTSIYIAKGNSNKYFYFKPKNIGEFEMKISARDKENTKLWEANQKVLVTESGGTTIDIVGDITSTSTASTTVSTSTNNTNTATTTIIIKRSTSYIYVSSHSDSEDLSNYNSKESYQISAGRDRVTSVGTPVDFEAKYNRNKNAYFTWSFGDGTSDTGDKVSHTYEHSGEYFVVLNAQYNNEKAVSRVGVKVLDPKIKIFKKNKNIIIQNSADNEINIGGWKISGGLSDVVLPKDTIINSKSEIILSDKVVSDYLLSDYLSIIDQSNNIVASLNRTPENILTEDQLKTIYKANQELENTLGMSVKDAEGVVNNYKSKFTQKSSLSNNSDGTFGVSSQNNTQKMENIATVNEAISSTSSTTSVGFFKRIISMFYNL